MSKELEEDKGEEATLVGDDEKDDVEEEDDEDDGDDEDNSEKSCFGLIMLEEGELVDEDDIDFSKTWLATAAAARLLLYSAVAADLLAWLK